MATVTHTIHSHYDPKQRESLQLENDEQEHEADDDPWQTESSLAAKRRLTAAPRFVPATVSYDEWGLAGGPPQPQDEPTAESSLAGWYRSLTSQRETASASGPSITITISSAPQQPPDTSEPHRQRKAEPRNKNNWFIMKAIQSEPSSAAATPPPTLADMLARDPPPLPTEDQFSPPVFLALGPSNRGFAMLQQSGWNEGEALGPHAIRRGASDSDIISYATGERKREMTGVDERGCAIKQGEIEVLVQHGEDVSEVRKVDLIDLTLSDSDENDIDATKGDTSQPTSYRPSDNKNAPYAQKALLTPIPTILKSDRLGIGLKAKTVGPHKASQKRVTHNKAALAAHIRASEEMRRKKNEVGRGSRGMARAKKKEEAKRQRLLAYMNE